jgi:hypothetical protein
MANPGRPQKSDELKRVPQQVSMPKWMAEFLKKNFNNISGYIQGLIINDTGCKPPDTRGR